MTDLLHPTRPRPTDQAVHLRYEKAGLVLPAPPVPWNADAVVVELLAKLPPAARVRADFAVRVPGREPAPAELVRKDDDPSGRFRVFFRIPPPQVSTDAEILWKHRLLATVPLPVVGPEQFAAGLRLTHPTLAVRVGGQAVPAQTFVAAQCRGLTAAAVVRSPVGLAPLAELGLKVLFRADRGGYEHLVPVPLTGPQLAAREALVTATPPKLPRRVGNYAVTWLAGDQVLLAQRAAGVTAKRFVQSLRVSDARFAVADKGGTVRPARHAPLAGQADRVGPCFVLASREPGAAAVLPLQVAAVLPGAVRLPVLLDQTVLITDGPTVVAPGLIAAAELAGLTGFELRYKEQVLGVLSLSPVPSANFTAEGAFKPPPDFSWSPTAEDELADRLGKLMGDGPAGPS
ncbi:MAG: hypothetical protein U0871_23370 [Gemmataceae bacterium]